VPYAVKKTLSEMFIGSRGRAVSIDGKRIQTSYKQRIWPNHGLRVTFIVARPEPLQGLRVKVSGGRLFINGRDDLPLPDVVLWTDTAPKTLTLRFEGRKPCTLLIWNCWEDDRRVTQAWIGNAGIIVEKNADRGARLRCNSRHEMTFADLVVDIERLGAARSVPRRAR
jgi:hypothetical protein